MLLFGNMNDVVRGIVFHTEQTIKQIVALYPEWPHRQVVASHAEVARSIPV